MCNHLRYYCEKCTCLIDDIIDFYCADFHNYFASWKDVNPGTDDIKTTK